MFSVLLVSSAIFFTCLFSPSISLAVSTRAEMIKRKKKKAEEKRITELLLEALKTKENEPTPIEPSEGTSADRAPQPPPAIDTANDVVVASSEVEADPRKCHRPHDNIVPNYVPRWCVVVSDVMARPAPDPAKTLGRTFAGV